MTRVRLGTLALALGLFATPALYGQHTQPTEGVRFGVGTMHAFLESRYMSIQTSGSSLTFLPISLGLMFGQ